MAAPRLPGKTVDEIEDAHVIDGDHVDISDLQGDLDSQLLDITSSFNADVNDVNYKIGVYKVVPNTGKLDWLFDCTIAELPIQERVRDEYGAGQYAVWIYKNKKIFRRLELRIGSPRVNATPRKDSSGDNLAEVVRAMMEQQNKQMAQFQTMMLQMAQSNQQPAPQQTNMLDMMQGMAAMMASLSSMMPKPSSNDTGMLIQGITLAKELLGDGSAGERNVNDVLAKTIETFGPAIADGMARAKAEAPRQAAYIPAPRPAPAPVVAPRPNPSPAPTPTGEPEMTDKPTPVQFAQLKMAVGMLVQKAATQSDPSLYAELVCDNVEERFIEMYLTGPAGLDNLISVNPNVARFRPWFEELRREVHALLTDDDESSTLEGNDATSVPDESDSGIDADS